MSERAQSEVLGFVLVFAVVVATTGLVAATAYPALSDQRNHQQTDNAERGMESLAANVDDLVRGDAPSRATEVNVDGGSVGRGAPVTVTVSGEAVDGGGNFSHTSTLEPVVYRDGEGTRLRYVGGAVVRADAGGARMVREPRLLLDQNGTVVPLVETRLTGAQSTGGTTTVLVRTTRNDSSVAAAPDGTHDLTVSVDSPHPEAWNRYLSSSGATCSQTGTTVSCDLATDRVHVSVVEVDVRFE